MRVTGVVLAFVGALALGCAAGPETAADAPNYLDGFPATNPDGTVNVVVECPAGSREVWQVGADGVIRQREVDGAPFIIDYLPFPLAYGMIPRTLIPAEEGGEGEQLDIHVLGADLGRGEVVQVRVIGALALLDKGQQDDKLLAVVEGPGIGEVRDLDELRSRYPGITEAIETWWVNFKGQDVVESSGWVGAAAARRHIKASHASYEAAFGGSE